MKRVVDHEKLAHLPMILETPWIGKDSATQRPMYEAEIALLSGDVAARFGDEFLAHLEKLEAFFRGKDVDRRAFVLSTWEVLKNDAKAKKADPREPMDRLYDMVAEDKLFTDLTEEQINHRLTAWLAGASAVNLA